MPERLNVIGTGQLSSGAAPNSLLGALPESCEELGYLELLGEEIGLIDRIGWPELLTGGDGAWLVDAAYSVGGGGGATGSTSGITGTVTLGTGWTVGTGLKPIATLDMGAG